MDFLKLFRLVMLAMPMISEINQAIRNGESVLALLERKAPSLIALVKEISGELLPGLTERNAVQAGAQIAFDLAGTIWIQTGLNKLINAGLVVDGEYGELTTAAVKEYQTSRKMEVIDGWAGQQTVTRMQTELAEIAKAEEDAKAASEPKKT